VGEDFQRGPRANAARNWRRAAAPSPPARDIDELRERLDDPAQRDAVDALQRARWAGGDGAAARRQLRAAFARGPRWKSSPTATPSPLPPLYPHG